MRRGRVRGGRAEGVPGRSGPPGGVPQAGGGWRGRTSWASVSPRAGPRRPRAGPGGRGQLPAGVRNSQRPESRAIYGLPKRLRYPFAGLPASRAAPGARGSRLDGGWRGAAGCGRPGACGSPALEGVETGGAV